jgi:hypothetical protein
MDFVAYPPVQERQSVAGWNWFKPEDQMRAPANLPLSPGSPTRLSPHTISIRSAFVAGLSAGAPWRFWGRLIRRFTRPSAFIPVCLTGPPPTSLPFAAMWAIRRNAARGNAPIQITPFACAIIAHDADHRPSVECRDIAEAFR